MVPVNLISSAQFTTDYDKFVVITDSRHVDLNIVGFITKDRSQKFGSCGNISFVSNLDEGNEDLDYLKLLSRGGLTISSTDLIDYVCNGFCYFGLLLSFEQTIQVYSVSFS